MEVEIWKDIPGYEGLYQVSNLGRVKSMARVDARGNHRNEKILKNNDDGKGYRRVVLSKDAIKKYFFVHRLVALVFIPNPNNYPIINHKDENPENNNVSNLEWCDFSYNSRYGTALVKMVNNRKGKTAQKPIIQLSKNNEIIHFYPSIAQAARETGIRQSDISMCCSGINKSSGGYIWRYI